MKKLDTITSTREKIKDSFQAYFIMMKDKELRQLYKEFISISLANPDKEMMEFQTTCVQIIILNGLLRLLNEGIKNGELKEGSQKFARGLFVMAEGMFIYQRQ